MRIEIERKRLVAANSDEKVRMAELACYFTLCGMDDSHRFLALKSAVTIIYKMGNFITAGHCARQICELESTGIFAGKPEMVDQYKKIF